MKVYFFISNRVFRRLVYVQKKTNDKSKKFTLNETLVNLCTAQIIKSKCHIVRYPNWRQRQQHRCKIQGTLVPESLVQAPRGQIRQRLRGQQHQDLRHPGPGSLGSALHPRQRDLPDPLASTDRQLHTFNNKHWSSKWKHRCSQQVIPISLNERVEMKRNYLRKRSLK